MLSSARTIFHCSQFTIQNIDKVLALLAPLDAKCNRILYFIEFFIFLLRQSFLKLIK